MNAKLVIAFIVVAIMAVGVYLYSSRQADAPTTEDQTNQEEDSDEGKNTTSETSEETGSESATEKVSAQSKSETPKSTAQTTPQPQTTYTPPAAPKSDPLPYSATVIYDGGRFIPDEVTIIEGGTVRFVNTSSEVDMWIVTDSHPTHNLYPIKTDEGCSPTIFDQCEAVGQGGSWSFTFDRFGGWRYHNEERARDTGIVHVLTIDEYNKKIH